MGQADEESAATKAASCVCPQSESRKEKRGRRDELNDDSRHAPRTRYTMSAAATTTRTRRTTKRAEEVSNKREKKRTQGSSQKRLAIATVEPRRVEASRVESVRAEGE